jgi:hypothetical protein
MIGHCEEEAVVDETLHFVLAEHFGGDAEGRHPLRVIVCIEEAFDDVFVDCAFPAVSVDFVAREAVRGHVSHDIVDEQGARSAD